MAKKFYAVKKGIKCGIYTTWKECKENVNGVSGAIYKGFSTEEEAKSFMGMENSNIDKDKTTSNISYKSEAVAYVDGSYENTKKEYSYGVVMFYNGCEEHFSEKFSNLDMVSMRNVAGEIEGAKRAMQFCVDKGIKSLDIIYDYEGIEKWCTGVWQAKKIGTKAYKSYYDEAIKLVHIKFIKVKGHSGDKYNDLADSLAKGALGIGN